MSDPLLCLRNATIGIAIWNILYSLIQMGVMGWQTKEVKDRQWEFENRMTEYPANGAIDGFQARFPGLYQRYLETPERRRVNAMYVIVLINIGLAILHFFVSFALFYGAYKYYRNCVWPWIISAVAIIIMSTTYAVLWWSGDVFNEQLTMSVIEFVMALAINGPCLVVVIFFYWRLCGQLTSDKPAKKAGKKSNVRGPRENVPSWRREWPSVPDVELQKKIRRENRTRSPGGRVPRRMDDPNRLDFYAPETYDQQFPWKVERMQREQRDENRRTRPQNTIETLYYENNPEELPGIPTGMRQSIRRDKEREKIKEKRNSYLPHQNYSVL